MFAKHRRNWALKALARESDYSSFLHEGLAVGMTVEVAELLSYERNNQRT
jgi:hypothetical protein